MGWVGFFFRPIDLGFWGIIIFDITDDNQLLKKYPIIKDIKKLRILRGYLFQRMQKI